MKTKAILIAEAGVNHNGDINLAKQLIDVAAAAGADFVKFQTFKTNLLVTQAAKKAQYQIINSKKKEVQYEMLSKLELTERIHFELKDYSKLQGIGFLSSAFDLESLEFLEYLGQKIFKVPSGEITNLPYLRHIGGLKKEIILSTGMSFLNEIKNAIEILEDAGTSREKITVLHCTSEYPAPMQDLNLRAMQTIESSFGVNVGYSDHSEGIEVALAAVAMGAKIIEKHFTIDRNLPGPDHKASLEPLELKAMVCAIRNIELALGSNIKRPSISELKNLPFVRKSIVAAKEIKSGELFTTSNITVKRPGTGVSPMLWDIVIGKKALRDFNQDELIEI
ncbi:N-acetylneuraminate synthase [Candidatus Methylopumilus rimovensis]|uniref:N-acetylneuraminate synthase n=1 Tax=Candidatus Methylopumilus rimovensis TaxID=2588535 RepID=A0AAE6KP25_9PROT|nr:N-acetylneuraminate synthase [Candidatus Methylopumilus rimovensis]QDD13366.1 N-acetylneuraminate synthase [Candidatus Methylopumilus rimovensis]